MNGTEKISNLILPNVGLQIHAAQAGRDFSNDGLK